MTWLIAAILIVLPWVTWPWPDWARYPKEFFFQIAMAIVIISCIALRRVRLSGLNLPFAIYLAWLIFTLWKSQFWFLNSAPVVRWADGHQDIVIFEQFITDHMFNILFAALFYAMVAGCKNRDVIIGAIIGTSFWAVIHGIIQFWYSPFLNIPTDHPWRVMGFFGNPNNYNEHLAIVLPLFLFIERRWKWIIIALAILAISMSRFWTSYSLGAGLCALPVAFGFYILMAKRKWFLSYVGLVVLGLLLLLPLYKGPSFSSIDARMEFVERTIVEMKKDYWNPMWGWGFGNYKMFVGKRSPAGSVLQEAHNEYLQNVTETGLVGLSLLIILLIDMVRRFWKARKDNAVIILATSLLIAGQICLVSFPMHITATGVTVIAIYALFIRETDRAIAKVHV